jgi:signal transduction histidine kinase/DNA-binding response OmpR family regulator
MLIADTPTLTPRRDDDRGWDATGQTIPVKVLIVDDLPDKRLVYRTVLEELGAEVVAVESGPDALKQILKHDFAVILLDVNMPGMDGFETAVMIRSRKRSAHTPIIFLTAFADEVRTAQGYASGAVDYLPTPVVPEVLRAKVRVFIDLYRMRQQIARQAEAEVRRTAAEEAARRAAFLANTTSALARSLDYETTLRELARVPLPQLSDIALVTLIDEHGAAARTEVAWIDESATVYFDSLADPAGLADWLAPVVRRVLKTGQLELLPRLPEPAYLFRPMPAINHVPAHGPIDPGPTVGTLLALPLVARGRTLGALALGLGVSGRQWEPNDLSLAQELSGRAGIALDNAALVRNIQDGDRRKNEFLATLAHELRNPLAPIRNALQILRLSGDNRQAMEQSRVIMERQVNQMVRLVDDLLDISRINRNKLDLRKEWVPLKDVIDAAIETSRPMIEAAGHRLQVSVPDDPVRVEVDPTRLAQVLSNLLNNAAKYTEPGGNIRLSAAREADAIVLRVRDDGIGIPPEAMPQIFDLFSQVDLHEEKAQGGLGIGLSLVRRLVEMHGGTVEVASDGPGQGSEFAVRLPHAGTAPPDDRRAVDADRPATARPHRILVVDDNVDSAHSLGMMLELMGNDVRTAHDGFAAVEVAAEFRPGVVLLDIGMPKMNGYEAARHIREQPWGKDMLLIAQTGWGQEQDRAESEQAGFDHHLVKPIDPAALQRLLDQSAPAARP